MSVMGGLDAAIMTGDALTSPMHVAALMIFTPPDDAGPHYLDDIYRESLDDALALDPRLRRHPHIGRDTFGMWTWREAEVNLAHHVQRLTLPDGSDEGALWRQVADLHQVPLDRHRPQWMAYMIDGLPGGRFAFYVKIHHALVDGVTGMQMIADALSTDPNLRGARPFFAAREEPPAESARSPLSILPNPVSVLKSALGVTESTIGLARNMISGQAAMLAGSVQGRSVLPMSAPFTRFNGQLGPERAVAGGTWSFDRIRAIRATGELTCNDVLMAVVSGALRSYLAAHDELPDRSLVAFCPISVRVGGDAGQAAHGNLFGLELCTLATDSGDPAQRLATIHRSMEWAKQQVADHGSTVSTLLAVPSIVPSLLQSVIPFSPKWRTGYNVPISNIRGPAETLYYNGARLDTLYPISTVFDGLGINITVYSYAGVIAFGYVAGRNIVPDIETLVPMTDAALSELESAVGLASPAKRPGHSAGIKARPARRPGPTHLSCQGPASSPEAAD